MMLLVCPQNTLEYIGDKLAILGVPMISKEIELPYFDGILEEIAKGNTDILRAFGNHVHWGYWDNPGKADGTVDDFAQAAENLTRKVYEAAGIKDGMRILDCGCGFGGTIASLNKVFSNLQLVGLNIDPRQLEIARQKVQPQNHNQIQFIEGDACQLPFENSQFDIVLAVECIFHFPSRKRFFQEVWRVLKTDGKLSLCDFVPTQITISLSKVLNDIFKPLINNYFGYVDSSYTIQDYHDLAKITGFKSIIEKDITPNTIPTYPFLRKLNHEQKLPNSQQAAFVAELVSRLRIIRYIILSYSKIE
jgi:ubiquinone/menaquinone biosynthesis C-methylase UbiE